MKSGHFLVCYHLADGLHIGTRLERIRLFIDALRLLECALTSSISTSTMCER